MPKRTKVAIRGRKGAYYHDLDPYTFHGTKSDATGHVQKIRSNGIFKRRKPRVATFYTILQDRRKNSPTKFGSVPQGPHTFPHHGLHRGLVAAREQGKLEEFGQKMVLTPSQYRARVDMEIPLGHIKRARAEIAIGIYVKAYQGYLSLSRMKNRTEDEDIKLAHRINRLLQLDPWGTYGYKGSGVGRKALKNKGETSTKPLAGQIDFPKNSGFSNPQLVHQQHTQHLNSLKPYGIL